MPRKKNTTQTKIKEKAVLKQNTAETVTQKEVKKAVNVAIATKHESLGANFDTGHI